MPNAAMAVAFAAMLAVVSVIQLLPASRWTRQARFLLLAFVLAAVALTMTASTELAINPGPLQIWGLIPPITEGL